MTRATRLLAVLVALGALALAAGRDALAGCPPTVRAFAPASGVVGTSLPATVTGNALSGATASVFGEPGVAVQVTTSSDTSVSLQIQIDAAAAPGERIVSLATASGVVAVDFTVNPAGGPVVSGIAPVPLASRGAPFTLTLTGQNLAAVGTGVAVTGAGVTFVAADPLPDGTRTTLEFSVAADAEIGTHAIVLSTPLGGAVIGVYVQRPAPRITRISPAAGSVGSVVPLTITGSNLRGAALAVTTGSGRIAVSNVATPDDSTLTATLTVPSISPESEPRLLIITTESGQATDEFFVVAAGVPSITSVRPAAGEPGRTTAVTVRGRNLTGASLSTVSPGVTVQNAVVLDDETLTADVVLSAGAATGTNATLTASVGANSAGAAFRIIPAGSPFIGAVRPPFGNRGASFTLDLDGVNLAGVTPGTGVSTSGTKVTVSGATAIDAWTVRSQVDVGATASAGLRDVTVQTTAGSFTKSSSFRVNVPGQVPVISDVTPGTVLPGTTTTVTVTGSGLAGAGVSVGGPGAVVAGVASDPGGGFVVFDLTLAADAPAETRPLLVVTENGIATCAVSSGADLALDAAAFAGTGSAFEVPSSGFRLFLFEFSLNARFDAGPRTCAIASTEPRLTLTRADAERVRRAVRDLPFGWVRVRAVTATNQVGTSAAVRFRR